MTPETFLDGRVTLWGGDNREALKRLADNSIDAVVTDPPYALVSIGKRFGKPGAKNNSKDAYHRASAGFMGKQWDTGEVAFATEFWAEVFRVLKPGGHVIAASGTRTYHRLACAIEDAGFEIRDEIENLFSLDGVARAFLESLNDAQRAAFVRLIDESTFGGQLLWIYGSGFPKSLDVSKAIDKAKGCERGKVSIGRPVKRMIPGADQDRGGWIKDDGREYQPGVEIPASAEASQWQGWGTALKPACEPWVLARKPLIGTVAENVLAHGTGGLNIDGCRAGDEVLASIRAGQARIGTFDRRDMVTPERQGRHPANVIHDGSPEVLAAFQDAPGQQGVVTGAEPVSPFANIYGDMLSRAGGAVPRGDSGSASRFFYSSKADADDRLGSKHLTVKPLDLMQYLCRLVTPPGGTVLDPFAGTGTTGEAAWREGFSAVLMEREADYQEDIRRRMALALAGPQERKRESLKARGQVEHEIGGLFGGDPPPHRGGQIQWPQEQVLCRTSGRAIGPTGLKR